MRFTTLSIYGDALARKKEFEQLALLCVTALQCFRSLPDSRLD